MYLNSPWRIFDAATVHGAQVFLTELVLPCPTEL